MSSTPATPVRMRLVLCVAAALSTVLHAQTRQTHAVSPLVQHYHAAQAAMARGDKDAAAYQWRMFLTDALGEIAINDAHADQYQKAASAFEQALTFAPHSSVLLLEYAEASLHGGDLDTARSLAAQITRDYPQNAKGHMLLGQVLLKQEKNADARAQFKQAATLDPTFGSMHADKLPVDSNELIALCAPRLTFISYGIPAKGDAQWLDQRGSWMATLAASPVWTLLGAPGLSTRDFHYQIAPMPPVNDGLLGGKLAWRQDDGGHTDAPNVKYFIQWADGFIGYKARD